MLPFGKSSFVVLAVSAVIGAFGSLSGATSAHAAGLPAALGADGIDVAAATVPDAPVDVAATPDDQALTVSWAPGFADGGSPVGYYDVTVARQDADPQTATVLTATVDAAAPTSTSVSSLVNGASYIVSVTATNAVGTSLPGVTAGTPRTTPGAPSVRGVTAGNGSAVVRWAAPAGDGGAPITSFVVVAAPSGVTRTVGAADRQATVTGLRNGMSTTFTVQARNVAGAGPWSRASTPVTPRRPAHLVVTRSPRDRVVYGTTTAVGARLLSPSGAGIGGQRIQLERRLGPNRPWRRIAAATTGSRGAVAMAVRLPASAALRLRHRPGAVVATDTGAGAVSVAQSVRIRSVTRHTRLGQRVVVRGVVGPAKHRGARVLLQQRAAGRWHTVSDGRMVTARRFRVGWTPHQAGAHVLRVLRPADALRRAGVSRSWRQQVAPRNAADVAWSIRRNSRITLATSHESGVVDAATARQNIVDVSLGRLARRSSYQHAPGGSTSIDMRLLAAVERMGKVARVTISEIAGGSHAWGSKHYSGRAVDISAVNGASVGAGAPYGVVVDVCRAFGATEVFDPGFDPYGGHGNHVHCQWS